MSFLVQSVKGTEDLYSNKAKLYKDIENISYALAQNFGVSPINLPILEHEELFKRTVGEHTDIVSKEMFVFKDRANRSLCLRPEGTAQTVRFVLEHAQLREPLKRYFYMGAMFRAEKPQKGRQRQFHQIGLEFVDETTPESDIEVITYSVRLLEKLGLTPFVLKINSIGCKNCRPSYLKELQFFLKAHESELCEECNKRAQENPLRVFDCKNPSCQLVLEKAPHMVDFLCEDCSTHFETLKTGLNTLNISFVIDTNLVRGLDYYTQTAFEISLPDFLGAQSAVCGGGRYNYLFEAFNPSVKVGCVGVAFGVERLMIALTEKGITKLSEDKELYYFITNREGQFKALLYLDLLRRLDKKVLLDADDRPLSKKLKRADKLEATRVIFLEEQELKNKTLSIKNMKTGIQQEIPQDDLANYIESLKG